MAVMERRRSSERIPAVRLKRNAVWTVEVRRLTGTMSGYFTLSEPRCSTSPRSAVASAAFWSSTRCERSTRARAAFSSASRPPPASGGNADGITTSG